MLDYIISQSFQYMLKKLAWLEIGAEDAIVLKESDTLICTKMYGYRYQLFQKTADGFVEIKDYGENEQKMFSDFEILKTMPHVPLFDVYVGADGFRISKGHCIAGVIHCVDCNGKRRKLSHAKHWKLDKDIKDFDISYTINGDLICTIAPSKKQPQKAGPI